MRVTLSARNGEQTVPVTYVDLDPEEEDYVLATLDPLGALAATDQDKLLELISKQDEQTAGVLAAMRGAGLDGRKTFSHIDQADQAQPSQVYQGSSNSPAAKVDRERYPLAIVLDRPTYEKWQTWKKSQGVTRDNDALTILLNKVIAEVSLD